MTQKEIAKRLNISRSTVARAFNGGRINHETKTKILELAKKIGYKPNNIAQALVRKNHLSICAVLIDSISPIYVDDIIKGIKLSENKYSQYKLEINILKIEIASQNASKIQYDKILDILENNFLNGLIVSFIDDTYIEEICELCKEKKVPLITLDNIASKKDTLCHIGPDYYQMGSLTADFIVTGLRESGRILLLNFEDNCGINRSRIQGFLDFSKNFKNIKIDFLNIKSLSQDSFNEALSSCNILEYDSIYTSFKSENILKYLKEKNIDKKFFIAANDLNSEIQELLYARKIMGIIYQRPFYQGLIAVETMFNFLIKNSKVPSNINIGIDILLKENLYIGLYHNFD